MHVTNFARFASEALGQERFTLVDVGCSSGIDDAWRIFGERLRAFAFDPNVEEIQRLSQQETLPGVKYVAAFVGTPQDAATGSIRSGRFVDRSPFQRLTAYDARDRIIGQNPTMSNAEKTAINSWKQVPLAPEAPIVLADFLKDNEVADIDFFKIDVDGADFMILRSVLPYLNEHDLLGLKIEVNFFGSGDPDVHTFHNVDRLMKQAGFELFTLSTRPYSTVALPAPFQITIPAQTEWGRIFQGDAIYFRDVISETQSAWAKQASALKLLKLAALFSMFSLPDCAAETVLNCREKVSSVIDVSRALDVLTSDAMPKGEPPVSYEDYMKQYRSDHPRFWPALQSRNDESLLERKLAQTQQERDAISTELSETKEELEATQLAFGAVLRSRTWRVTSPLRHAGVALRRLLRR